MSNLRNQLALFCALSLLTTAALADPASAGKSTFRWVDDKGVVHYGDRIPPEYATRDRAVLNNQGIEVGHLAAQRTAEQIAEDARTSEAQRKQFQHDSFLLTTYQSIRDIEQLRDARLQQMADQSRSTQTFIDSLNTRLGQLQIRAQSFRPYSANKSARPMPDQLAEDIVRTLNEVRAQRQVLDGRDKEEKDLRAQFQVDIDRYRQLKSGTTASR